MRITIIGAGTLGVQIALQAALAGQQVTLYDTQPAALERAQTRLAACLEACSALQTVPEDARARVQRVRLEEDLQSACRDADLLSENIPEKFELKAMLFAHLRKYCGENTILATNTSIMIPSMFLGYVGRPQNFLALHFHPDVWATKFVDIMPHPGTSKDTIQRTAQYAQDMGLRYLILQKENHGYVFNFILDALSNAAMTLAANGVASVQEIDDAFKAVSRYPLGPFESMDDVGLDVVLDITSLGLMRTHDPQLAANAKLLESYVKQGKFGKKTGEGFYKYT